MMFKIGTPVACYNDGSWHLGVIMQIERWQHSMYKGSDNYFIVWDNNDEAWYDEEWVEIYVRQAEVGKELKDEIHCLS